MRLLIAEDQRDLAEALTFLFEKNQFTVDAVYDGRSAYDYGVSGQYDAIILDVMMPGLTGIEVLRRLREENISTPVMMLTAKAQKDDRITGFNAGAARTRRRCCGAATRSWTPGRARCAAAARACGSAGGNFR